MFLSRNNQESTDPVFYSPLRLSHRHLVRWMGWRGHNRETLPRAWCDRDGGPAHFWIRRSSPRHPSDPSPPPMHTHTHTSLPRTQSQSKTHSAKWESPGTHKPELGPRLWCSRASPVWIRRITALSDSSIKRGKSLCVCRVPAWLTCSSLPEQTALWIQHHGLWSASPFPAFTAKWRT